MIANDTLHLVAQRPWINGICARRPDDGAALSAPGHHQDGRCAGVEPRTIRSVSWSAKADHPRPAVLVAAKSWVVGLRRLWRGMQRWHIGEGIDDVAGRFLDGWNRMAGGEDVNEKHVSFATWETFVGVMTPKRLQLLRHVHREPAKNIHVLAKALGRDYRRVHEDVEALVAAELLERDADGLRAEYDAFRAETLVAL